MTLKEKHLLVLTSKYVDQDQKISNREINAAKECAKITLEHTIVEFQWTNLLISSCDPAKELLDRKILELQKQLSDLNK